jgi:hypothetical protein
MDRPSFVFFLVALVFMGSKIAYADPHAVFYTATGQQQLFFNVLAGLNQADYVEPANPQTGTPAGQSRQDLNQAQQTAGNQPKATVNDVLNAGQTKLSSILTRNITLQGNDVWSSYQAFQLALEASRRRYSTELIQILCGHGFGLKNCKTNSEDTKTAAARESEAIETNPQDITARSQQAVDSALFSGTEADQQDRLDLLNNNNDNNKFRPYNPSVGALNANTADSPTAQGYVDSWAQNAANLGSGVVDSSVFNDISFDTNGNITSLNTTSVSDDVNLLSRILAEPAQFFSARVLAEDQQTQQDSITEVNGVKADTVAVANATANGTIGEISQKITLPATAKLDEQSTALQTLGAIDSTRYYTSTSNSSLPAKVGQVEGITTDSSTNGQVLGTTTDASGGDIPEPTDTLPPEPSPSADNSQTDFNQEPDIQNFLDFLIDNNDNGGCGNTCSTQNVIDNYGSSFLGK